MMCMSVPQMPTRCTRTSTSPSRGIGTGRREATTSPGLSHTTTSMSPEFIALLSVMGRVARATIVTRSPHVHADGGDAVVGTGDEERLAVAARERVVGGSAGDGNVEDIVALRVERHHTRAIADVDVAAFIHRHAISTPVAELAHVGERAVTLDVEYPGSTVIVVEPFVDVELLAVGSADHSVRPCVGFPSHCFGGDSHQLPRTRR